MTPMFSAAAPAGAARLLEAWAPPPAPYAMVIEGRYVQLEPLADAHAPALFEANRASDDVWTWLPYGPFATLEAYRVWLASMISRADPRFFAVIPGGGAAAGVASLMRITPAHGTIEVGHICLAPRLQRTPASSEMVFLLADWCFAAGYRRLEWKCDAANRRSRRAAERAGFSYEGIFRNHMVVKGRNRDTAWFAMTDGDWNCLRPAWTAWLDSENFAPDGRQRQRLGALTGPCRVAADPAA